MKVQILDTAEALGRAAACRCAEVIAAAIREKGKARVIFSTGASQFSTIEALLGSDIDFSRVEAFHLDEYIGLPDTHKASFRKYLRERLFSKKAFLATHLVSGEGDVPWNIAELNRLILEDEIDLGIIGIGENAHIAFNDPPADFTAEEPYIVVTLNDTCKSQQVREGWFPDLDSVPKKAVSMSVRQILRCLHIVCPVPHAVKADAIAAALSSEVTPLIPATILKTHPDVTLFLDENSASGVGEDYENI